MGEACDDRVLASGVKRSDYAELLILASETLRTSTAVVAATAALLARTRWR